jgi:large subunit ribosomal protein L21
MYAIIQDGKRQFVVEEGQELVVDYRELSTGAELKFEQVLAIRTDDGLKLGTPLLGSASVTAEVLGDVAGPKLVVQKFRRRKNMRRRTGHRQTSTRVRIKQIVAG